MPTVHHHSAGRTVDWQVRYRTQDGSFQVIARMSRTDIEEFYVSGMTLFELQQLHSAITAALQHHLEPGLWDASGPK